MKSKYFNGFILIFFSALLSVVVPFSSAYAGYRDGRPIGQCGSVLSRGYFSNECRDAQMDGEYRGYVLPIRNVGGIDREAMYGINTIDSLLSYLKNYNDSTNERLYGPAAFIVHSMLGRSGDQANASGGKKINAADWAEVEARLRAPEISIDWNVGWDAQYNTSGRVGGEVAFVNRGSTVGIRESVVIRHNGTVVYILQRECANPIGDLPGLPAVAPPPTASPSDFTPTVNGSPDVAVIGQNIQFQFSIRNNSSFAGTTGYQTVITTTSNPNYSQSSDTTPIIPSGGTFSPPAFNVAANENMGGRICASLIIDGGAGFSQDCVTIGRKPLFQVWGGDVWAGGSFASGPSNSCAINPTSPGKITGVGSDRGGSWGEYGVFATGNITSFGSAAQARYSGQAATKLAFANTASEPGFYHGNPIPAIGRCLSDMFAHFGNGGTALGSSNVILNSLSSGTYTTGDVTVRAPGPLTTRVVIVSSGTITIDANASGNGVRYRNVGNTDISSLPQLVLLAENIVINNSVTTVDAWLGARNTIYTCEEPVPLDSSKCNNPLTINGPVVANEIILKRTSGAGNTTGNQPAEKFNLRPDSFLRAYADKSAGSQVRTLYQQELPPRY